MGCRAVHGRSERRKAGPVHSDRIGGAKDDTLQHTGTGRISRLMMRPMSLFESLESNGMVSLKSLFDGKTNLEGISNVSIESIASAIVRGGWPASIKDEESVALRHAGGLCGGSHQCGYFPSGWH